MSLIKCIASLLFLAFSICASMPAVSAEVCPSRPNYSVRFVDVFDGAPEAQVTLVPDKAQARSGYWKLGYVYESGRFVTIRCKYVDGNALDVKLNKKVNRCDYRIDFNKKLTLHCK